MTRAAGGIAAQAGIGLRFAHHHQVMAERPAIAWLEVHPENYLGRGVAGDLLENIRRDYPLSLHATGLSLGSADGVDRAHLDAIAALAQRVQPGLISDHLSWSSAGGIHLPDLLPLPYTKEALEVFARNIDTVQDALGRTILIENPSVYLAFAGDEMREGEFLAALIRATGCGVLLDINNVAVSAGNLGDIAAIRLDMLLQDIPAAAIGEIHLAGHAVRQLPGNITLRIDDHGSAVNSEVWALYEATIRRIGARPTLIEWDTAIPALDILAAEARKAATILQAELLDAV